MNSIDFRKQNICFDGIKKKHVFNITGYYILDNIDYSQQILNSAVTYLQPELIFYFLLKIHCTTTKSLK